MPKKVHQIQKAVKKTGKSEDAAWAIAQATYQKMKANKSKSKPKSNAKRKR